MRGTRPKKTGGWYTRDAVQLHPFALDALDALDDSHQGARGFSSLDKYDALARHDALETRVDAFALTEFGVFASGEHLGEPLRIETGDVNHDPEIYGE